METETEVQQPRIRIQKINFNGFSDSDECTGGDSNSQQLGPSAAANSGAGGSSAKKGTKAVTLIFQKK